MLVCLDRLEVLRFNGPFGRDAVASRRADLAGLLSRRRVFDHVWTSGLDQLSGPAFGGFEAARIPGRQRLCRQPMHHHAEQDRPGRDRNQRGDRPTGFLERDEGQQREHHRRQAARAEPAQQRDGVRAQPAGPLPVARVQRDYGRILRQFGLAMPAPKPRATAPGRRMGTVLVPTSRQPMLKRRQYAAYSDVVPNISRMEHWHRGGRGVSGSSKRKESPYSSKRWTSGKVPAGVAEPRCDATQRFTQVRAAGRCSRAHRVR